jgi:hypothetical protein
MAARYILANRQRARHMPAIFPEVKPAVLLSNFATAKLDSNELWLLAARGRGQKSLYFLVRGLVEVLVPEAHRLELGWSNRAVYLIDQGFELIAALRRGGRHRHDELGRLLRPSCIYGGAHARSRGKSVIHEYYDPSSERGFWPVTAVGELSSLELGFFLRRHCLNHGTCKAKRLHDIIIEHQSAASCYGSKGEFFVARYSQLANEENVEGCAERRCYFVRDGNSASREREDEHTWIARVIPELLREDPSRVGAVAKPGDGDGVLHEYLTFDHSTCDTGTSGASGIARIVISEGVDDYGGAIVVEQATITLDRKAGHEVLHTKRAARRDVNIGKIAGVIPVRISESVLSVARVEVPAGRAERRLAPTYRMEMKGVRSRRQIREVRHYHNSARGLL